MDEGVFAGWLVEPGDSIASGEMLFQLEGEKATQDIETFDAGILCVPAGAPQVGETVAVGQVVGYLLAVGEEPPTSLSGGTGQRFRQQGSAGEAAVNEAAVNEAAVNEAAVNETLRDSLAGPAVRRLARELEVDLNAVVGSGPKGRVTVDDVRNAVTTSSVRGDGGLRTVASPRARRAARERGVDLASLRGSGRNGRVRERDVMTAANNNRGTNGAGTGNQLRRAIARRMLAGVQETAPVTLTKKVRVDRLVQFRAELKQHPVAGLSPTFNELILKLTSCALRKNANLNGIWRDDRWQWSPAVHLAFAVDTPAGLMAPVIPDADSLSLAELTETSRGLVSRAGSGELSERELSGGTFTVSNLGGLGIDAFTPIINLPQIAILGVGRAVQEPVVEDGQLDVGWTLHLSLTIDHRAVDGADGARLLQTLGEIFEFPARWLFQV
jgi:pyruvate dehydrogenase E2 component (dihydrolipoamide acetyltransferase)